MTYFGSMNPAVGGSHAAGQPLGDLLQLPLVAVRVGEGRAAKVRAVFRVPACDRALVRVEMPDCADLDTPVDQILAGNVDVVNDQDQALERLRVGRQALAELNRRRRTRRGELHPAGVLDGAEVDVETPSQTL